MSRWTVDAGVAVKWFVSEAFSDEASAWLEGEPDLFVPELFFAEVPNVLWKKVIRRQMTEDDARMAEAALDLALSLTRSAYDCCYLAVARAYEAPLVTADQKLLEAVRSTPFASRV